jgi:hypothetical protein
MELKILLLGHRCAPIHSSLKFHRHLVNILHSVNM